MQLCYLKACHNIKKKKELNKEIEGSRDNNDKNQPFMQKRIIPSDLNDIQPRATQVWNCDEF